MDRWVTPPHLSLGLRAGLLLFAFTLVQAQIAPTHITVNNPGVSTFPDVLTGSQVDFRQMIYSPDGKISHSVSAVQLVRRLGVQHVDDPEPNYVVITRHIPLWSKQFNWVADVEMFAPRTITPEAALLLGVTQAQLASLGTPDPTLEGPGLLESHLEEACTANDNGTSNLYPWISGGDRRQGTLNLVVDIPATASGLWRLGATSALGEVRYTGLVLLPGPQLLQITNVEAGNCLVSLTAISSDLSMTTFHREVPVVVRKDTPGLASMRFVTNPSDILRFRLHSLSVGQNSQDENAALPLIQGSANPADQTRAAMVRVMAYDAMGAGPDYQGAPFTLEINVFNSSGQKVWTTTLFNQQVKTYLAKSARIGLNGPGPVIPSQYVQPGMKVQANLINPSSYQVAHTLSIQPTVIKPRKIIVHGFDVRPYHGDSGCPLARTPSQMGSWVLPYTREVFPYSDIEYQYDGKIWLMDWGQLAPRGIQTNAAALLVMNTLQGWFQTDPNAAVEHIYVAFLNQKYGSATSPGMAWYGYRGAVLVRIDGDPHPGPFDQGLGYNLAHEMGHCFSLEHAPSAGANEYSLGLHLNRVDQNYPYGGAGLSGGWGYSALGHYFLAEDTQTIYNNGRYSAHWDPMSYSYYSLRDYTQQRFSDTYTRRLIPGAAAMAAPMIAAGAPNPITLATLPSGIKVFDATSAAQATAWFQGGTPVSAPQVRPVALGPNGADPLAGVNPALGDPDDPTPPVLIVVQTPAIPNVTVLQ